MRNSTLAVLAALTLGVPLAASATALAQSQSTQHKKVLGYQDAETGEFHPLQKLVPDTSSAPVTGKYEVTFEVTLKSSFPSGTEIACEVIIEEATDVTSPTPPYDAVSTYSEIATGTVAAGAAGSTATCTASLPYSWIVPAAPTGGKAASTVGGSYSVYAANLSNGSTLASVLRARSSTSALGIPSKLPATGATTSLTVNVTL